MFIFCRIQRRIQPVVYWDEDKIEQVLTNLIDNAIRHTPSGWKSQCTLFMSKTEK